MIKTNGFDYTYGFDNGRIILGLMSRLKTAHQRRATMSIWEIYIKKEAIESELIGALVK